MLQRLAFLVALLGVALAERAEAQNAAVGQWLTEDGSARVDIFACEGTLCGRIVWLKEPVDDSGRVRRDALNEDSAQRNRPLLGLPVLAGFTPDGPDRWEGGTLYVPEAGREYRASVTLRDANMLIVRRYVWWPWVGWVPWLSTTEQWKRVAP
ncbi:MAG: DUF2147 domain-containing protein [Alphaproteobacteria bacterium]|nr:DUF2147 domain-containing protein [Alphaproteobacteria bacterium]